jgi:hypothetical protein
MLVKCYIIKVDRLFYLSTFLVSRSSRGYIVCCRPYLHQVIATNARKPIFGYRAMIMSIIAIGFLSTIVWGITCLFLV